MYLSNDEINTLKLLREKRIKKDFILEKLFENCVRSNKHVCVDIKPLRPSSNLFVLQNTIMENAIAYYVTLDYEYNENLLLVLNQLVDGQWREVSLPEEIHLAFVVNSICFMMDLMGDKFDDSFRKKIFRLLDEVGDFLWEDSKVSRWGEVEKKRNAWNHSIVGFSAIGNIGLLLRDGSEKYEEWINLTTFRTELFFRDGVTDAGMTREGLAYCGFVFRNLGLFMRGLKFSEIFDIYAVPEINSKLINIVKWYASETFPAGKYFNNHNDSYWDPHQPIWGFLMTFSLVDRELVDWVWSRTVGSSGLSSFGQDKTLRNSSLFEAVIWGSEELVDDQPPGNLPLIYQCTDYGYLVERDSWGDKASVFTLNCGKYLGGIHDQSDNGQFTFFIGGDPVCIDAGAANKALEGSISSSFGHNLVLINGLGQLPSGEGHGVDGELVYSQAEDFYSFYIVKIDASYNKRSYNTVEWYYRYFLFIKEPLPCLIVIDDVFKDSKQNEFESLLHVPGNTYKPLNDSLGTTSILSVISSVLISVRASSDVEVSMDNFVSNNQHPYLNHDLFSFKTLTTNPLYLTSIMPVGAESTYRVTSDYDRREFCVFSHSEGLCYRISLPNMDTETRNTKRINFNEVLSVKHKQLTSSKENKRLWIHLGIPKTGSSALQVSLAKNRDKLLKEGIDYLLLSDLSGASAGKITSGNGMAFARSLLDPGHEKHLSEDPSLYGKLLQLIDTSDCLDLVLSSELFSLVPPEKLLELQRDLGNIRCDLRIVFYVRRQDQFLMSVYMQKVKRHGLVDFPAEFVKDGYKKHSILNYYNYTKKMSDVIGKSNIFPFVYENTSSHVKGIFGHFISVIRGHVPTFLEAEISVNTSPSPAELKFLLYANRFNPNMRFSDLVVENSVVLHSSSHYGSHSLLSPEMCKEVLLYFSEQNELFVNEFSKNGSFPDYTPNGFVDIENFEIDSIDLAKIMAGLFVAMDKRLK